MSISTATFCPLRDSPTRHQNFIVLKTLHKGEFSTIFLTKPLGIQSPSSRDSGISSKERMVLKAVEQRNSSCSEMFYCDMDYNYFFSPHENVVTSYNVVLRWKNYYIFAQEYAPAGDLAKYLKKFGALSESKTKIVARQLSSALDFIHGLNLVHQAVIPENILVFNRESTIIKLTDFCRCRPSGSLVMKGKLGKDYENDVGLQISSLLAYSPPEVCCKLPQEKYHVHHSIDVWSVGIIIWACLSGTGHGPWQSADVLRDPSFRQFYEWTKKKSLKVPDAFQPLSCRLLRLIKRLLEPKPEKRCKAREVLKYINDDWLSSFASKNAAAILCRLGVSRSESCKIPTSGTHMGGNVDRSVHLDRASSQKYVRRTSVSPQPKSEIRKTNNGGNNSSANSPRTISKVKTSNVGGGIGMRSSEESYEISCVLETTRAIMKSTSIIGKDISM